MQVLGVTESAVQHLRERIITGELKPGQRLNEIELSEALGISRPPLREALRTLARDYLVESIPRRGAFVTPLSLEGLNEIYSARSMVETHAVEIFGEKNIRDFSLLMASVEESRDLQPPPPEDANGWLLYWKAFSDFHYRLVELAQNTFLLRFYKVIGYNLARYQVLYLRLAGSNSESVHGHLEVVDLLENGDYDLAKTMLKTHVERTHEILNESIKNQSELLNHAQPA